MRRFDEYPKSFKQAARYIRQEANLEQLQDMERVLSQLIYQRKQELMQRGTVLKVMSR